MGVLQDLDRKYSRDDYWRSGTPHSDDTTDDFEADMQRELEALTPDQRIEIFRSIIEQAENEFEDCAVEKYAGECVRQMVLIQIMKQLVPHD